MQVGQCCWVSPGHPAPREDDKACVCSVQAWWDRLMRRIDTWGYPSALDLGSIPASSWDGRRLHELQPYLEPWGVLCSGHAGEPGLAQAQVDNSKEGYPDAGAVSQDEHTQVRWARGPLGAVVQ